MSAGRVLHTGQAVVDLVLRVPAVPAPGEDVFATAHDTAAGGGFNVLAAAARDGAAVVHLGGHGTGPFGDRVRAAMAAEGVLVAAPRHPARDTGFTVALVDDAAERTFVSTVGAEGEADLEVYRSAAPRAGDVVHVSGYSMLHAPNRAALLAWLPTLPAGVHVVVDPSPVVGGFTLDLVGQLAAAATVWSCNEREAGLVTELLGITGPADDDLDARATALAAALRCAVVLRAGPDGAVLVEWDADRGQPAGAVRSPGLAVTAVDTNGAGDAHCGVLCAALAAGADLPAAVHRATAAAGVAVTRPGPATSPTRRELDALLAG